MTDPYSDQPIKGKRQRALPELSDAEVEARIGLRGGQAPRAPVGRPTRTRRAAPAQRRTTVRDSALLLGGLVVAALALRFLWGSSPAVAIASASPASSAAIAQASAGPTASNAPAETIGGVISSLAPDPTPVVVDPTSIPTPTLGAGATPAPPTRSPAPTPHRTPSPTAASATLTVYFIVVTDSGGTATAGDWTVSVHSGTSTLASFAGSAAPVPVTVPAGAPFAIYDSGPAGYALSISGTCSSAVSGTLAAGDSASCTLRRNDRPAHVSVYLHIVNDAVPPGTAAAGDWTINVTGGTANASPSSFQGSENGVNVTLNGNAAFTVNNPTGSQDASYTLQISGTCAASGLQLGQSVICTFTENDIDPAASGVVLWPLVPFVAFAVRRRRARR